MSIASRITSIEGHIGNAYDSIKKFGVDTSVINRNIENIANVINDDIYSKLPKVTQSGTGFTLSNVQNGQVDDFKMIGTDLYQNQLPSEYTAVEYLQSDNECFIDTGINADYKLSLKMKVACLDSVLEYMGAIKNIDNTNFIRHHLAFAPTAGNIIGIYYGQTNDQLILKEFDNNFHEFNLDIYNKKVSIDNNSTISISYNNFDVGINYYLFARNGSSIAISKGSYKIAYCKMFYEDNLVRDFVPCYRNSDNVAGLYDFVTNTFFTNQGTGTFTVGNDITLPNPDYPQEIKVVEGRQVIKVAGKNKFDFDTMVPILVDKSYGKSFTTVDFVNKSISITSWDSDSFIPYICINHDKIDDIQIDVKPYTNYIFSVKSSIDEKSKVGVFGLDEITNKYVFIAGFNSLTKISFNTGEYSQIAIRLGSTLDKDSTITFSDIQLEEGTTATDYEPYHDPVDYIVDLSLENIQLAKIPNTDYKNRIYKNNGNWYFEKQVEKIVLDGGENFNISSLVVNGYKSYYIDILNEASADYTALCNYFKQRNYNDWINLIQDTFFEYTKYTIGFRVTEIFASTLNDFKNWLSTHNVEVWYPLATPITTQITNTTLINQLEAISVHTGTNIITLSSDNNMTPEIEITRLKQLERLS